MEDSKFTDNLSEIDDKFYKDIGEKYADGWAYRCRVCGAYAFYAAITFHCQGELEVPQKIRCSNFPACSNRWTFKLTPKNVIQHG